MIRIAWGLAALSVGVAGCGQSVATGTSRSVQTSSSVSGAASSTAATQASLFAVLETRHCPAPEPAACGGPLSSHDTVAIAGLDGFAKAKTSFTPRAVPQIGNAESVLQLEGQVAAGGVYVIDGKGTVRRLAPDGTIQTVATFPLTTAQQEVSFAVSPDGKQFMAAVMTFPTYHASTNPNAPFGNFSGPHVLNLELATAGGRTATVAHWQSGTTQYPDSPGGFVNINVVAWDAQGPIALVHAATGTQNAWLNNQHWFNGSLARLHLDGTLGPTIGPAGCLPYWRPVNGRFVCTETQTSGQSATPVKVVSVDGTVLWSGNAPVLPSLQTSGDFAVSPNGARIAMDGQVVNLRDNSNVALPDSFWPQGWLADDTLIGIIPSPHTAGTMGIIHLSNPQQVENWGFFGAFVGLVR